MSKKKPWITKGLENACKKIICIEIFLNVSQLAVYVDTKPIKMN